jgi:hypothetical protein
MQIRNVALVVATLLFVIPLSRTADAASSDGASYLAQMRNFSPIEKAACGPFRGRWFGPFHHRVCGYYDSA